MKTYVLAKTALKSIVRHSVRTILTILGIMIGVAAIIITFSIGRGAEEKIKAQILTMGEGAIYMIPGNVITRGAVRSSLTNPPRMTTEDLESIRGQIPGIRLISRGMYSLQSIEYGAAATKDQLLGTDSEIFRIGKYKLQLGVPFTTNHVQERVNVAVIGQKIKDTLFGQEYPLGKTIRIAGNPFIVIGVLSHQEHFVGSDDPNGHTFIPFTVAKKFFRQPQENENDLGFIAFDLYDTSQSERAVRIAKRILRFRHDTKPGEEDDFIVFDQQSITNAAEEAAGVIKLFGLIAASISLLVGGIGIMNIMLVSVQERKQEIGLRIALGAPKKLVQLQFLIEAATLCGIGGLIGILIGILGQYSITYFTSLTSVTELLPIMLAFFATIFVGIFFGYYPARKAAALNPIDALLER